MNLFTKPIASTLMAGTVLLTGSYAEAAPMTAEQLAEKLGLPINDPVSYYNKAFQTAVTEECTIDGAAVSCTLMVESGEALLGYSQRVDYTADEQGRLSITTSAFAVDDEWQYTSYGSAYDEIKDTAVPSEWSAQSPLAHVAPDGRVVQNDSRMFILEGADRINVTSSTPISEQRGMDIHIVFDGARRFIESYVVPRVSFDGAIVSAEPADHPERKIDYSSQDVSKMEKALARTAAASPAFRFPGD